MKLPRFSIREILILTTIVALSIPYIYRAFEKRERFDFSYFQLQQMVRNLEPGAILINAGGGEEFGDLTYLMPVGKGADLVTRIHSLVEKQIVAEHWTVYGSGSAGQNDELAQFSYELVKDRNHCKLQLLRINHETDREWDNQKGLDKVRLIFFSVNYSL